VVTSSKSGNQSLTVLPRQPPEPLCALPFHPLHTTYTTTFSPFDPPTLPPLHQTISGHFVPLRPCIKQYFLPSSAVIACSSVQPGALKKFPPLLLLLVAASLLATVEKLGHALLITVISSKLFLHDDRCHTKALQQSNIQPIVV